jgi:GNAT superfamily N-acetyltransferase
MKPKLDAVSVEFACTVRPAQPRDCDRIAELTAQLGYQCSGDEVRQRFGEMQDANQYAVFVAQLPEGQVAGWIGAYLFRAVEINTYAEISGLVVDEDHRSHGIGKILLDAAEKWARSVGCQTISVRSNVKRDRAHQFYAKYGYEHLKTQKEFRNSL